MEKTMRFLSIAALALVGAVMTGCSSEDNFTAQPQQQVADKGNVVTMTATVGLGEQAGTRKLTIADSKGVKTFAADDQIAVIYENTSGMVKETVTIAAGDISTDGKSAKFTVTMTDPKAGGTLKYIYPAAMAGATDVDYTKLNTQDGTLTNLGKNLDLAVFDGNLTAEAALPASATLENKLAILAVTLKNSDGSSDITDDITGLTLSDGTYTYNVSRSAAAGPIYVAIRPTSSATIYVTATDGTNEYAKTLATTKTYAAGNGYSVSWKMAPPTDLSSISGTEYTVQDGEVLTGTLGSNVKISIADGATVTLKDVNITNLGDNCNWAGINCPGDATLVLEGTNVVSAGRDDGGYNNYPGIWIASGKTLTIQGAGTLTAYSVTSYPYGAGIGGGYDIACGNIVINSGNITATGGEGAAGIGGGQGVGCGNITINGGTITATGGMYGAGIGGGNQGTCGNITISGGTIEATGGTSGGAGIGGGTSNGDCGNITITSGVTSVTATKGSYASNSIGRGEYGTEITVTIEDPSKVTRN